MHARKCATHHVDDLLQREPELELQRLGLVEDGALQVVVLGHLELQIGGIGTRQSSRYKKRVWLIPSCRWTYQVVDESPLVGARPHTCNGQERGRSMHEVPKSVAVLSPQGGKAPTSSRKVFSAGRDLCRAQQGNNFPSFAPSPP